MSAVTSPTSDPTTLRSPVRHLALLPAPDLICSGFDAVRCPVHGACSCAAALGDEAAAELNLDPFGPDPDCPLHGPGTMHAEPGTDRA
jgi:hypothetical protein